MGALSKSRKNIDAEIMYEMRRQNMTNKQIAEAPGLHVSTVYAYIGRKSEAVKHAEVQNKPPVVDVMPDTICKPEKPAFRPCSVRTARGAEKEEKPLPRLMFASYSYEGSLCKFVVDTSDMTVELMGGTVNGLLDSSTIGRFIKELQQVEKILQEGKVSA